MNIQVITAHHTRYPNLGRYLFCEMRTGKHHATVSVGPNHLQVCVHNAANRTWRGMGRRFPNAAQAAEFYRTPEIKQMIQHAAAEYAGAQEKSTETRYVWLSGAAADSYATEEQGRLIHGRAPDAIGTYVRNADGTLDHIRDVQPAAVHS